MKYLTLILVLLLSGCSLKEGYDDAKAAVGTFHDRFAAEDYGAIYADTTEELRNATSKDEFLDIVISFRDVLGKPLSTKMQNIGVNASLGAGTVITGVFLTKFENGQGVETFVFKKDGEVFKLQSYNLNSNDYIRLLREKAAA